MFRPDTPLDLPTGSDLLREIGVDRHTVREIAEDGGYVRGMVDRLRELEARQDELTERLSAVPADLPDIHPNVADIYWRKVAGVRDVPPGRGADGALGPGVVALSGGLEVEEGLKRLNGRGFGGVTPAPVVRNPSSSSRP